MYSYSKQSSCTSYLWRHDYYLIILFYMLLQIIACAMYEVWSIYKHIKWDVTCFCTSWFSVLYSVHAQFLCSNKIISKWFLILHVQKPKEYKPRLFVRYYIWTLYFYSLFYYLDRLYELKYSLICTHIYLQCGLDYRLLYVLFVYLDMYTKSRIQYIPVETTGK